MKDKIVPSVSYKDNPEQYQKEYQKEYRKLYKPFNKKTSSEKQREYFLKYAKTEKGKKTISKNTERYRKTDKGAITSKIQLLRYKLKKLDMEKDGIKYQTLLNEIYELSDLRETL